MNPKLHANDKKTCRRAAWVPKYSWIKERPRKYPIVKASVEVTSKVHTLICLMTNKFMAIATKQSHELRAFSPKRRQKRLIVLVKNICNISTSTLCSTDFPIVRYNIYLFANIWITL